MIAHTCMGALAVVLSVSLAVAGPRFIVLNEVESGVPNSIGFSFLQDSSGVSAVWVDPESDASMIGAWSAQEGLNPLQVFDETVGWSFWIEDISADGQTLAGFWMASEDSERLAAVWSPTLGTVVLGSLGVHPDYLYPPTSHAFGVSGQTVVGFTTSPQGEQAFRWTPLQGMVALGDLMGPDAAYRYSVAMGVQENGTIVGHTFTEDGRLTLVKWEVDSTITDLAPQSEYEKLQAFRASVGGTAMVGTISGDVDPRISSFVWSEDFGLIRLDYPGETTTATLAQEVSDDGSVVWGIYNQAGGGYGRFLWRADSGFVDFDVYVAESLRLDLGDWRIFWYGQLSPDGKKLTGQANRPRPGPGDEVSAFILDISPPCRPDFTDDGTLNFFDLGAFLAAFQSGDTGADIDGNGVFDVDDVTGYVGLFAAGCP